jgi:hypothetical protein
MYRNFEILNSKSEQVKYVLEIERVQLSDENNGYVTEF